MRYTTIIDISSWRQVYRSETTRLVYLHLCLTAGYHETDRDLVDKSIRTIARETDLSKSAVEHAIRQLQKYGLVQRQGAALLVKKFVMGEEIGKRAKSKREERQIAAAVERQRQHEAQEREYQLKVLERQRYEAQGTNAYIEYCKALKAKADAGDVDAAASFKRHESAYNKWMEDHGK